MLKQAPSRNQGSKGFKVKHAVQISMLLAICIWLLYQLKHSHDKKAYEESSGTISGKMQNGHEIIKLGRRDLHPRVDETSLDIGRHKEKEESEEEIDESKADDQERAEEESEGVEDLIDEEDTEREEESEEQESDEDMGDDRENLRLLEDQARSEDTTNAQEIREEHYKADDASNAVKQNNQTNISTEIETGSLQKVKEEEEVDPAFGDGGTSKNAAFVNAVYSEERGNQFGSANLDVQTYSSVKKSEQLKLSNDSTAALVEIADSLNGTEMLPKLYRDASQASGQRHSYSEAFLVKQNESPKSKYLQSGSNLSATANLDATKRELAVTAGSEAENVVSEATAELAKNSDRRSTNENDDEVGNGKSRAYGRVERSVGSLVALTTNGDVDDVQNEQSRPDTDRGLSQKLK